MTIDDKTMLPFYKALIENTRDVVTLLDTNGLVQFQSPSITTIFGYDTDELIGTLVFDKVHAEDRARALSILLKILEGEEVAPFIVRFQHKNGSWRFVEVIAHFLEDEISGVMLNSRDVTEFEETSQARRLIDASFEAAFNASSTINSITMVESGEFINVNNKWVSALGWSRDEAIGKTAHDLKIWGSSENRINAMTKLKQDGRLSGYRVELTTKSGEVRTVLLDAVHLFLPVGTRLYISALDITEMERTEEKLRQSQRLDAVGHLTGGIAHDFNNLLSVILGHAEIAGGNHLDSSQVVESLAAIRRASVTGANLIQQLLSFARKQRLHPTSLQLGEHLEAMKPLLQTTIAKDIKLEIEAADDDWYCHLDPLQLDNAILNMTINARDAMPTGGTLKFIVQCTALTEHEAAQHELEAGDYLKLSLQDTGSGMSDATKKHAFDPFYTTKQDSGGSGLGLSMVFGFINQSGGKVFIEPSLDGSIISILLPRASAPSQGKPVLGYEDSSVPQNQKALLVEDNSDVRLLASILLKSLGFHVTEVASASESDALEQQKFDLLVCDVMLPGPRKGPDIARKFLEQQPELAVLYMSGFQQGILTTEDLKPPYVSFIQKPFSRDEFAGQINKLLQLP
jgi:two-component system cell cycle sensor histidine kinase/response regulator CckA